MKKKELSEILETLENLYDQKMKIHTAYHIINTMEEITKENKKYNSIRNKIILNRCNLDIDGVVISMKDGCDEKELLNELKILDDSDVELSIKQVSCDNDTFFDKLSPRELKCLKKFFYI